MTTHIRLQRRNFAVGHEKTAVFDKKTAVLVARCTEKDITGFFEKSACGKAFSGFFVNPHCPICRGCDTFSFLVRTEKDISKFKRHLIILVSCD